MYPAKRAGGRGAATRWRALPAVLGVGAYVIGRASGWHPEALGLAAMAVGLTASVVLGVLGAVTRKGGDAPADRDSVPVHEAPPAPAPEVLLLVEQGRKIQAIKHYRQVNRGIGLKQAKDVIDGLQPGQGHPCE